MAPWNVDPSPFLILEQDPDTESESGFMQAEWYPALRRGDTPGFLLEYHDGSVGEYWETYAVSIEDATEAFIDYLHGRDRVEGTVRLEAQVIVNRSA